MISHMPRPHSHKTSHVTTPPLETGPFMIWFGYYWQPSRPPSTPYQTVRWSLVVQYGADWGGSVRVHITNQFSSWIDPECYIIV